MKKLDIFLIRVLFIVISIRLYYGETWLMEDILSFGEIHMPDIILISSFLLPIFFFKIKNKIKNRVIIYEILFFDIFVFLFNALNNLITADFSVFYLLGKLQITIIYLIIVWLLLSYYDFSRED